VIPVLSELKKSFKIVIITQSEQKFIDAKLDVECIKEYIDKVYSTVSTFGQLERT